MSITFGCQRQSLLKYWAKFCKGFFCQDWELSSSKWSIKLSDVIIRVILVAIAQFQIIIDCCPRFPCGFALHRYVVAEELAPPLSPPIRCQPFDQLGSRPKLIVSSKLGHLHFPAFEAVSLHLLWVLQFWPCWCFFLALLAIVISLVRFYDADWRKRLENAILVPYILWKTFLVCL